MIILIYFVIITIALIHKPSDPFGSSWRWRGHKRVNLCGYFGLNKAPKAYTRTQPLANKPFPQACL